MSISFLTSRKPVDKASSNKAQAIIRHVIDTIAPRQIYLIGSMLRGQVHAHSDLDLLVVVDDPVKRQDLIKQVLPTRPHKDLPLDLHLVGEKHFSEFKDMGGICFEGAHHGRCIYQREGL